MKLRILDETGDTLLTDEVTEGIENVKKMSSKEIKKEFDKLINDGYTAIDEDTKKIFVGRITKTSNLTMLYPIIGG